MPSEVTNSNDTESEGSESGVKTVNGEWERHILSNSEGSLLSAQSTYAMSMGPAMPNFVSFIDKQDIPIFSIRFPNSKCWAK